MINKGFLKKLPGTLNHYVAEDPVKLAIFRRYTAVFYASKIVRLPTRYMFFRVQEQWNFEEICFLMFRFFSIFFNNKYSEILE